MEHAAAAITDTESPRKASASPLAWIAYALVLIVIASHVWFNVIALREPVTALKKALSSAPPEAAWVSYDRVGEGSSKDTLVATYEFKSDLARALGMMPPTPKSFLFAEVRYPLNGEAIAGIPEQVERDAITLLKGCKGVAHPCRIFWHIDDSESSIMRYQRVYGLLGVSGFSHLETRVLPGFLILILVGFVFVMHRSNGKDRSKAAGVGITVSALALLVIYLPSLSRASFFGPFT